MGTFWPLSCIVAALPLVHTQCPANPVCRWLQLAEWYTQTGFLSSTTVALRCGELEVAGRASPTFGKQTRTLRGCTCNVRTLRTGSRASSGCAHTLRNPQRVGNSCGSASRDRPRGMRTFGSTRTRESKAGHQERGEHRQWCATPYAALPGATRTRALVRGTSRKSPTCPEVVCHRQEALHLQVRHSTELTWRLHWSRG